jgi:hypothetical protein
MVAGVDTLFIEVSSTDRRGAGSKTAVVSIGPAVSAGADRSLAAQPIIQSNETISTRRFMRHLVKGIRSWRLRDDV